MKFWKKNDGLTLVELMISIAIGSMILLATSSVLLLGLRIHHKTTETVTQQFTARTVITMLENLATEGDIEKIERSLDGSWKIYVKDVGVTLSYSSDKQTIYTGNGVSPMLENIVASYLVLKGNLLTISLEDKETAYSSSVYCRFEPAKGTEDEDFLVNSGDYKNPVVNNTEKDNFVNLLMSQVGTQSGVINQNTRTCRENGDYCGQGCFVFDFFSEWYIGGYANNPGWNASTPWCACFVSWGLAHTSLTAPQSKWFANVDTFMEYFTQQTPASAWKVQTTDGTVPAVGDIVFFNMISEDKNDPSHVGVVIQIEGDTIITVEGNSADMVAIREYAINDPHILGYGDPWAAAPQGG